MQHLTLIAALCYFFHYSLQGVHITNGEVAQPQANYDTMAANTEEQVAAIKAKLKGDLTYSIDEIPPWYNSILLGFQVRCKRGGLKFGFRRDVSSPNLKVHINTNFS